jgi:hypothetical protein
MISKGTSEFTRRVIIVAALLFIFTLGALILPPLLFSEGYAPFWTTILNGLILAIPTGLLYSLLAVIVIALRQLNLRQQVSLRLAQLIYWCPRIGAMVLVAFMSLFALDSFESGLSLGEKLLGFLMHMLPMLGLAAVLAVAWRWPWVGAAVYSLAALAFLVLIFFKGLQGLGTFIIFGGPLLVIALLFAANGRWKKQIELARHPAIPAG